MDAYGKFAEIYDSLMEDVPYQDIADVIDQELQSHQVDNKIILDMACGTGTLTAILKQKGYDMIGTDLSPEMLHVAQEKCPDTLFLLQSMEELELYGTVGCICCCLDSINYLTEDGALDHVFHLCNNYLEPNGLLIFDINSEYKFQNILADNIYTFENEKVYYTWENYYMDDEKLCDFYLTFFVREGELYSRFDETHTERCYSKQEITDALEKNGFAVKNIYDGFTQKPAHDESERLFFVCENVDSIQLKYSTEESK